MNTRIEVFVDLKGETVRAATAHFRHRGNTVTTSVVYETSYLSHPEAYEIDPVLRFDTRSATTVGLPGAFADSAPDRWGRRLITRRIRSQDSRRAISELDFLLGVADATRQGAVRFSRPESSEFVDPRVEVPKLVRLPELLHAADVVAGDDDDDLEAVKLLLDAGTGTLGGARPKASVQGDDGALYIAKFPHPHDSWDVMAWEKTVLDLAQLAGIRVPHSMITSVASRSVLLVKRFDRVGSQRVGYLSGMTLIRGRDGDDHDYLDLAGELMDVSSAAEADLEELWRRIAFSVAIHNTDDHMRNHGVLRSGSGWRLSPVFDINPNPELSERRATSIAGVTERELEISALLEMAADFGLSPERAIQILAEIRSATASWRGVASRHGISRAEQARFSDTFDSIDDLLMS